MKRTQSIWDAYHLLQDAELEGWNFDFSVLDEEDSEPASEPTKEEPHKPPAGSKPSGHESN